MAKMEIVKGFFTKWEEVMDDIKETGYWPSTYISNAFPELPLHYHAHDVIGYVMEGSTYVLDEDENKIPITGGDKLIIPKGSWHAEGEVTEKVVYIVTLRDAIPLMEGLFPKEPKGPFPEMP